MNRRAIWLLIAVFLFGSHCLTQFSFAEQPNVVIILADDLGYGDTQPLNPNSNIPTPNFTRLAQEGMVFTDAHSGSGVCTPTRYGLLCGRYAWRTRLKRGVLGGYSKPLVDLDQQTFSGQLQQVGYHTMVIGKWHLGLGWQWNGEVPEKAQISWQTGQYEGVNYEKPITDGPLNHGFSSCYLYPASLDMSPYVFINDNQVEVVPTRMMKASPFPDFYRKGETFEDFRVEDVLGQLTRKAQAYIEARSKEENPFCLYLPITAPHKPVSPSESFVGNTKLGPYGDFITEVDWAVGQVLKTLDETGEADNTIVIVTSDNGSFMYSLGDAKEDHVGNNKVQGFYAKNHQPNGVLRGTKADVWEAGHRVPFYVRWPNKMPAELKSTRCGETICLTDILATVCKISGAEFDRKASPDTFDFSGIITGSKEKFERPPVINHSAGGTFAIRVNDWKLVLGNGSGGRQKPKGAPFGKPYQLFDLSQDLSETKSVLEEHREMAKEMERRFFEIAGDDVEKK